MMRKVEARSPTTNSDQPRGSFLINDNYRVTHKGLVNMAYVKKTVLNVTSKKQTFVDSLNVNLIVATLVLIARGQLQKKGISPDIVQQKSLKYVKDVSCLDHLSFVPNITNVPGVAPDLPVVSRLHQFWEIWAALGASLKVIALMQKNAVEPVTTQKFLGFYNRFFPVSQTQQPVETYTGSQYPEHISREIQNGDTGNYKDLPAGGGVGNVHKLQGCLLPYPKSNSGKDVSTF